MRPPKQVVWGWAFKRYHQNNWTKYQLSRERFEELWTTQDGCCAICRLEFAHPETRDAKRWGVKCYVDHRHRLGETMHDSAAKDVRGLLCYNCNSFLGVVKEDITALKGAYEYLKERGVSEFEEELEREESKGEKQFYEIETYDDYGQPIIQRIEYT